MQQVMFIVISAVTLVSAALVVTTAACSAPRCGWC